MRRPGVLGELEDRISDVGHVEATCEALVQADVAIRVQGDIEAIANHPGGLLFAGNHKQLWEFMGLAAVLGEADRHDVLHIANFCARQWLGWTLGHVATESVLPVYPGVLARDRPLRRQFNDELFNRLLFRRRLLSAEESRQVNKRTVQAASDHLTGGGVLNIYPCGNVRDWRQSSWKPGIGRIIAGIPDDAKKDTMVVPYSTSDITGSRLVAAIVTRGRVKADPFTLHLGTMRSAAEVVDALPPDERDDPQRITESLRQLSLTDKNEV